MHQDYKENWLKLGGQQCHWCGHHTALRYLFPVIVTRNVQKQSTKELHNVCLECIAFERIPKGCLTNVPMYNYVGKKVNSNEKVSVAFSVPVSRPGQLRIASRAKGEC